MRKTDTAAKGRVIENPCTMPRADILQNILGQSVNLNSDGSVRSKRRKLGEEGMYDFVPVYFDWKRELPMVFRMTSLEAE